MFAHLNLLILLILLCSLGRAPPNGSFIKTLSTCRLSCSVLLPSTFASSFFSSRSRRGFLLWDYLSPYRFLCLLHQTLICILLIIVKIRVCLPSRISFLSYACFFSLRVIWISVKIRIIPTGSIKRLRFVFASRENILWLTPAGGAREIIDRIWLNYHQRNVCRRARLPVTAKTMRNIFFLFCLLINQFNL